MPALIDYKALFFDFDGVIADTAYFCVEEINKITKTKRFPKIPLLTGTFDLDSLYNIEILQSFKKFGFSDKETTDFLKEHAGRMLSKSNQIKIFKDVYYSIAQCPIEKFIVTSSPRSTVENVFKANNIDNYNEIFKEICGKETGLRKHDNLSLILSKYDLKKHEVVYVGDMVNDIINCKKIGIHIFVVPYGYNSCDLLKERFPDYCFRTKLEFIDFLQGSRVGS